MFFLDILKTKLFQLLLLGLIETVLFVGNCHVGYSLFGAVDVGMVGTKTFSFLLHQLSQRRIHLCTRLWGLLWHGNHRRDEQVSLLSLFFEPSMAALALAMALVVFQLDDQEELCQSW